MPIKNKFSNVIFKLDTLILITLLFISHYLQSLLIINDSSYNILFDKNKNGKILRVYNCFERE